MSASFRLFVFLAILAGVAEMCSSIDSQTETTTGATGSPSRKRRSLVGSSIVHIEFETTLTSAGDVEFSKVEYDLAEEYGELLDRSHRQVATGVDGGSVLKYMFTDADCGVAQSFAQDAKDLTSFVTGATIRCNDQITNI